MDFTVWIVVCFGSVCALSVLLFLRWWCRSNGAEQIENIVESADGGDTTRDNGLEPKHKVFLSHSGAQKNFVEQLCVDLERFDRYPFFDKRRSSLPIGENFPKLIFKSIEQCEVGVVVLSEEFFVRSKWPMLELVAMKKNPKLMIIPVYFGVSLDRVRDPKHQKRWLSIWHDWAEKDKRIDIKKWCEALKALGPLNSLVYDGVSEVSFRGKIVQAVCDVVLPESRWNDSHVRGRSRLAKVICEKINEAQVSKTYGIRLVGIYGVGGIGKTTICQTLCNEYVTKMQGRVFHMELGSASNLELLQGALKTLTNKSHDVLCGLNMSQCQDLLKREMGKQAIFLAIDNMSDSTKSIDQAKIFLSAGFDNGSIVIVTARSLEVLKLCHLDIAESNCFEMPELHNDEAKLLFLEHAIGDYEARRQVDDEIIDSCLKRCYFQKGDGKSSHYHPLALKVLGIQLGCKKYDRKKWAGMLKAVDTFNRGREEEHPVFSILRKSFDILLQMDRMLFMDVALFLPKPLCFDLNMTSFEWLSMVHRTSVHDIMERLEGLKRKSILQDLGDGRSFKIGMHDLWREFAVIESRVGEFECRKWVYEVGEPSALEEGSPSGGCWQNVTRMRFLGDGLMSAKGINFDLFSNIIVMSLVSTFKVRGDLVLDVTKLKHLKSLELVSRQLDKGKVDVVGLGSVVNLQFLHLEQSAFSAAVIDNIGNLTKLRVLVMRHFNGARLPDLSKLICLEEVLFSNCSGVTTGFSSSLSNLRVLGLHNCWLWSLGPGLGDLVALHKLTISYCRNLNEVSNLQKLTNLRELIIRKCSKIASVPGLEDLVVLEKFWVNGCGDIVELPNMQKLTNLRTLCICECRSIKSVQGLVDLVALQQFRTARCGDIVELPNLQKLTNLRDLDIRKCSRIKSVQGLDDLVALEKFWASGCGDIVELPNLQKLTNLRELDICNCSKIASVPGLEDLVVLEKFWAKGCKDIVELPNMQKLTNLRDLDIRNCSKIALVPGLEDLKVLEKFWANGCGDIVELPNMQKLTNLRDLDIGKCSRIKSVQGLEDLVGLKRFRASGCGDIVELPNLKKLTNLWKLDISQCSRIKSLPGFDDLVSLVRFQARGCEDITELPNLQKLIELYELDIGECSRIKSVPGLDDLIALQKFWAQGCGDIVELPNLEKLTNLRELDICQCSRIKSVPGLDELVALEELRAWNCNEMAELPSMSKLTKLQALDLRECPLESVPGMDGLIRLQELRADFMQLRYGHELQRLSLLRELDIKGCSSPEFMRSVANSSMLESLTVIDCRLVDEMPDCHSLKRLKVLKLDNCEFKDVSGLSGCKALERLDICGCRWLERLPDMQKQIRLKWFAVEKCDMLRDVLGIRKLETLRCKGLPLLREVPDLSNFPHLKVLDLGGCDALERLASNGPLVVLHDIILGGCRSLKSMPDLSHFPQLFQLKLEGCGSLMELTCTGPLASLKELDVSGCSSLNGTSELMSNFSGLRVLRLCGWESLRELPFTGPWAALEELDLSGCKSINTIPDLSNLPQLKVLRLCGLESLKELTCTGPLAALEKLDLSGCKSLDTVPDSFSKFL